MLRISVFLIIPFFCTFVFADEEITIKATGDIAKELKEIIEKYQNSEINGTIAITKDDEFTNEENDIQVSPIEQAMQEEIKKSGSTNNSGETYDQYFSDEEESSKGFLDSIFGNSDKQINVFEGKETYDKKCASCHGQDAKKSLYPNARNLITLTKNEIIDQVKNYRRDSGYGKNTGFIMSSQAIMVNDNQVRNIAEYINSLKK
ncbi:MAG: c-type cytochrome [Campylobacteraceae bacterium]|jgi:cytochrome c553|nr:c-type cytochrome [Campylobacteraceae bacterium]